MQNLPKIVRARLQQPTPAMAEPHPDADLLTAFAEHSLAARERDHVLEHLARCADCREVVALALPATEAVALASSGSTTRTNWLSWPVLRWGVVAAGVLAVTSIGILQYRQRHQEKTLVATISRERLAESAALSPAPAPHATATQAAQQMEMGKQTEMAKKSPSHTQSALAVNKPAPAPNATVPQTQPMRRSGSSGLIGGSGSGFGSSIAQSSRAVQVLPQRDAEPAPAEQSQIVGKAKPAFDQASPAMAPAPLLRADPTVMKGLAVRRWTISASGALQRSLDGGKTWLDVNVAVDESLSANLAPSAPTGMKAQTTVEVSGAAPLAQTETQSETKYEAKSESRTAAKAPARPSAPASVKSAEAEPTPPARTIFRAVSVLSSAAEVWAGGSGGTLYHTTDGGTRWARVIPSDAGILLTGDIIGIQFSDPRNGIVTTSDAEVWTTVDAGQTWHKRQ